MSNKRIYVLLAATAVAWELFQIFTTQGCPLILQHDNGKEFVNKIVARLKELWPSCLIVRGRPRHPQTQGSVERGNQDIHGLVANWMRKHNSKQWSIGIYPVAMEKNARFHRVLQASPYELLYGQEPRVKMLNLPLNLDLVAKLSTEAELANMLGVENYVGHHEEEEYDSDEEEEEEEDSDDDYLVPGLQSHVVVRPEEVIEIIDESEVEGKEYLIFLCIDIAYYIP